MNIRTKVSLVQAFVVLVASIIANIFEQENLIIGSIIESLTLAILAGLVMYFATYKMFKK